MVIDADDLLSADARLERRESVPTRPTGWRAQAVQRVQIGLIGLAAMVLLVGLANIIISNARQNQAQVVPEAAPTVAPQQTTAPVNDPLADVGVLPDIPVLDTGLVRAPETSEPGVDDVAPQEGE